MNTKFSLRGQNCSWWRITEPEPILTAVGSVKLTGWLFCPLSQEANIAVDGQRLSRIHRQTDVFMPNDEKWTA